MYAHVHVLGFTYTCIYVFRHTSNADAKNEQSIDTTTDTTPPPDPVALTKWKTAIVQATSSSQLAVCINQLERCIAWEKSPMKVVSLLFHLLVCVHIHVHVCIHVCV